MFNLTEMYNTTSQTLTTNGIVKYSTNPITYGNAITPSVANGTNTINIAGIYKVVAIVEYSNTGSSAVDVTTAIANNGTVLADTEVASTVAASGSTTVTIEDIVKVGSTTTGNNVVLSVISPLGGTVTYAKMIVQRIA